MEKIEGFDGPKTDAEPTGCTGCWDNSGHDTEADTDIPAGDPIYWMCESTMYDQWSAYCRSCATNFYSNI